MVFLFDHLKKGSFRTAYADTDSMCLGLTQSKPLHANMSREEEYRAIFDPIVKPEMRDSWETNWKTWFVTTSEVEDERFPGKLKSKIPLFASNFRININFQGEFGFQKGRFCALSPKCYFSLDTTNDDVKMGSKGVPYTAKLELQMYLNRLYNSEAHYAEFESLRLNKDKQMARIKTTKSCLNDLFVKFQISYDKVTCNPLKINGKYL